MLEIPRLLVDVDGTVAHFHKRCVDWANIHIGNRFTIELATRKRRVEQGMELNETEARILYDMIESEGFNYGMEPIEGCDILTNLDGQFEIFFLTDRHRGSKTWTFDRDRWLEKVFGSDMARRVIYAEHKYIVPGNLLIEDTPEIAHKWQRAQHTLDNHAEALLLEWPYNVGAGIKTFRSWKELPPFLDGFLQRYQNHADRRRLSRGGF